MKTKFLILLPYLLLFIFSYFLFYNKESKDYPDNHLYFLILAFLLPGILNFIFPKLRNTGFGTYKFFPYLVNLFKKR
ncbi:hypothetical protein SAMN05660493_02031 [Epilithonimonas bovis DSM 19482]|uniref:Uncharacterized protein n=1 Tax=Epilithonimonas bovis DSM 19482 TaxID=1121284 RepID=A0A1U7PUT5_9FLAO|nr:hypothetical protein SAMN05660493_02031 [Epilithonimonas bovis DSM 19482]